MSICAYTNVKEVFSMIDLLKAFADETRMRMFRLLLNGDMCVCEIEKSLKLSQSNASRHLTVLKKANILDSYKEAQWTYYKIADSFMREEGQLFMYLKEKVLQLPQYEEDNKNYMACRALDLCGCKKGVNEREF